MQEVQRQVHTLGALQQHLLPRHSPRLSGWRFAVHYAVGLWPGGNYYDFLPLPDGRLLFVVADASDAGGPAIVMDVLVRSALHSCPLSSGIERGPFCPVQGAIIRPPHLLLAHLNQVLAENTLPEQFMTAFCGLVSPADGELHYASAAHPAPRWWQADTGTVEALPEHAGLPLGLAGHTTYHHRRVDLAAGDMVVCYSEGLPAALNHDGQQFGLGRLDQAIADAAVDGAEAVRDRIALRLEKFLEKGRTQDDITVVVLERAE
jgi:serine phosphatase RsbU (regulator of sigma subunit)